MQIRSETISKLEANGEQLNVRKPQKQNLTEDDPAASEVIYPEDVPSLTEIKKVLGHEVFQSDLMTSMYFVIKDFVIISALYLTLMVTESATSSMPMLKFAYLPTYWFLQGTMFWALFCLGHDCDHGSFSNYWYINDFMGNILHTVILVPYYPWKLSHKHHHQNIANIDKDEIFYPMRKSDWKAWGEYGFMPYFWLGYSWYYYLIYGYGRAERAIKHFNPLDKGFKNHVLDCSISLACMVGWTYLCFIYGYHFGFMALTSHYLIPVFVMASWLILVTFLHHQEVGVPWYGEEKWNFVRGALSCVNRDYGVLHHLTHNPGTHQIHHLCSMIPHYKTVEATKIFNKHYPHLVRESSQPIIPAFIKMFKIFSKQFVVPDDTTVFAFKDIPTK